jgi:ABC-type branched-subunit amino acid transport system ATPase component
MNRDGVPFLATLPLAFLGPALLELVLERTLHARLYARSHLDQVLFSISLVLNVKLLLLDEPTEGLAPIVVEELLAVLKRLIRDEGLSAIVVEQHARKILGVTDHAIILDRGAVVHAGSSEALMRDPAPLEQHLGIARGPRP